MNTPEFVREFEKEHQGTRACPDLFLQASLPLNNMNVHSLEDNI